MRRLVAAIAVLAAFGALASPAAAKNQPDTDYYYGKGEAKKSDVSFVVNSGRVRKILMGAGKTKCEKDTSTIFKSFGGIPLEGRSFYRGVRFANDSARFVFAGRIHGAEANGRMKASFTNSRTGRCDSGRVLWSAHRVPKDEWKKHRHRISVSPPRN